MTRIDKDDDDDDEKTIEWRAPGAANCVTGQKRSLLALAKTWYQQLSINTLKLMQTNKAVCGFHLSYLEDRHIEAGMASLLQLYAEGKIKPRIDSCFHFEEVR